MVRHRGLDNAGKTTIVRRVCGEDHLEVSPTLGFQIKTLPYHGYSLNIWDVGGQKSLRSYWRNYFESTDALIWVIDSADVHRMKDCADELHKLLKEERLAGATLLILANKNDVGDALHVEEILDNHLRLRELDSKRHWNICACSAITGEGLDSGLSWLVNDVASRIFLLD